MGKITFRKQPRNTGLYSVGNPKNPTIIKLDKKMIGEIQPSCWTDNWSGWRVAIRIIKKDIAEDGNKNCIWKWIFFKDKFEEEELARIWFMGMLEVISKKWEFYIDEDEEL